MKKEELKKLILTASGARKADTVIKNCKVVNVFSGKIIEGDIALCGDQIAGVGEYEGEVEIDAEGRYAAPGFIDSHIHIESSYLSPEELGMLLVPHGGTTIIADPHEIVINVLGILGLGLHDEELQKTQNWISNACCHPVCRRLRLSMPGLLLMQKTWRIRSCGTTSWAWENS